MAVEVNIVILCVTTLCRLVCGCQCFRGTYCFHPHVNSLLKMQVLFPLKHRYPFTRHGMDTEDNCTNNYLKIAAVCAQFPWCKTVTWAPANPDVQRGQERTKYSNLLWFLLHWIPFFWQKTVICIPVMRSGSDVTYNCRCPQPDYWSCGGVTCYRHHWRKF